MFRSIRGYEKEEKEERESEAQGEGKGEERKVNMKGRGRQREGQRVEESTKRRNELIYSILYQMLQPPPPPPRPWYGLLPLNTNRMKLLSQKQGG